jgi:hypothetical protein
MQAFLDCSAVDIRMDLSDLVITRQVKLTNLPVEVLDSLLLSESVAFESENAVYC